MVTYIRILVIQVFIGLALTSLSYSQLVPCATDSYNDLLHKNRPELGKLLNSSDESLRQSMMARMSGGKHGNAIQSIVSIPVVVHVIHRNGSENISDAQILQGITDLNDAFRNRSSYKRTDGVDLEVEFCLAKQTPDGKSTTGITRTESSFTDMIIESQDLTLKSIIQWDPKYYLNIWLVKEMSSSYVGAGVAGYATFPSSHGLPDDGIVVEARWFGSSKDNSKIHIHECGHYLGLYHTFQGGCKNDDCLLDGDKVCDTPPDASTQAVNCGGSINSCNSDDDDISPMNPFRPRTNGGLGDQPDQFVNYMDYGDQQCQIVFTEGQKQRIGYFLSTIRASLSKSNGCYPPCPSPISISLLCNSTLVAVNTPVVFTNMTTGASEYEWLIDGKRVSGVPNYSHTFTAKGKYIVSLIASNGIDGCTQRIDTTIIVTSLKGSQTSWTKLTPPMVTYTFNETNGALEYKDGNLWLGIEKIFLSGDEGLTWKQVLSFPDPTKEAVHDMQFLSKFDGVISSGKDFIYVTNNEGATWQTVPGPTGRYALTATMMDRPQDICVGYTDLNIPTPTGTIEVTFDNGATWRKTQVQGIVAMIRYRGNGVLFALVLDQGPKTGEIMRSNDWGNTWSKTGGTFDFDCLAFAIDPCDTNRIVVMNEDQYTYMFSLPKLADVFITTDLGMNWSRATVTNALDPSGSIRVSPRGIYYIQTRDIGICRSTDQGMSWESIGGPNGLKDTKMVCPINDNKVFAVDASGSVWMTSNSGGDSIISFVTHEYTLSTRDVKTDTIGGTVRMPIIITGTPTPRSITMAIHYDPELEYLGTFANDRTQLDIPGQQSPGRSLITIPDKYFSSSPQAHSEFNVLKGGGGVLAVSFDSASVAYFPKLSPCEFDQTGIILPTSGIVNGAEGCGTEILADFIKDGKMPKFSIHPNPSETSVTLTSSTTIANAVISVYDTYGVELMSLNTSIDRSLTIPISHLPNGVYLLQIVGDGLRSHGQFTIHK